MKWRCLAKRRQRLKNAIGGKNNLGGPQRYLVTFICDGLFSLRGAARSGQPPFIHEIAALPEMRTPTLLLRLIGERHLPQAQ